MTGERAPYGRRVTGATTVEIGEMLAEMLAGVVGGDQARWAALIGPVRMLPIATNIHCNWSVSPIATGEELAAINAAMEVVRREHPFVNN